MIIHQVEIVVKPGPTEKAKVALQKYVERVTRNEPNFALYTYANNDFSRLVAFDIAADIDAYRHHIEEHQRDPATAATLTAAFEHSVKIFGNLPPDIEEGMKAANPTRYKPIHGLFNRTIAAEESSSKQGMVFLIGDHKIKPNKEAEHQQLSTYFAKRWLSNEPNYAMSTYRQDDSPVRTGIELFADIAALELHMDEHGREPELMQQMQETMEATAPAKVYGNVTPQMEQMLQAYGAELVRTTLFTPQRTIIPLS